jgi:glycosyltransferase involved in cell wall biosynthesis
MESFVKEPAVLSVFGVRPRRIGAVEVFAREFSRQIGLAGRRSVVCFAENPPEKVRQFLEAPNVSLEVMPEPWKWHEQASDSLRRVCLAYHPDIVHFHFTGFVSPYPWLAKLMGARQIYFTDQTSPPEGFRPRQAPHWKRLAARLLAPYDGAICVSQYGQRVVQTRGLMPARKVHLIYNSVDVHRTQPGEAARLEFRRRAGISPESLVIAQVSAMISDKGIADLLHASREILNEMPCVHLLLIGEGPRRQDFMALARELKIESRVTFAGEVSDPVADGAYAASDIVCQVSRWEEVFGYVIAEAMSCGKPMLATRVGGIPELVTDGETGYLVERRDVAAMADRLRRLLADPLLRRQMGERGRAAAAERFDHRNNVSELLELYGIGRRHEIAVGDDTPQHAAARSLY